MEENEQIGAGRGRRRQSMKLVIALLLVLLLLAITPPLLNVGRYQRRIVASMSESLGRPVHLDSVSLHLLPMPGFTLENFVVSEDPAFGNEPTIRANEVVATLRVSSLWKRRVEFSEVKFENPSVNLVRRSDGRWNLESVLLHASHVDTAPTAQQKAGEAPRFPYIEATGGRINLKIGNEKKPFSLTDADFALWLPSPQVWRVRLEGKPMRTDSNIGDPGTMRLEGSLQRAEHMQDVPVDLQASWHDAPLGEASKLISGNDRDWRGTLHADASLDGPLGSAALKLKVTLDELRRADFVPANSLDESFSCESTADLPAVRLTDLTCNVPVNGAQPLAITSPAVDLSQPKAAAATVQAQSLPLDWIFGWLRLFSQRIPSDAHVQGTVAANLTHPDATPIHDWNGTVSLTIPVPPRRANGQILPAKTTATPTQTFEATLNSTDDAWTAELQPATIDLGPGADLTLTGEASPGHYSFTLGGNASAAQLASITYALPQLADDTGLIATKGTSAADTIRPVALTCERPIAGGQVCSTPAPPAPKRPARRPARRRR
ncbi:MAG TPA: AsmA family protein [Candidatus Aquilonibacter sp.]|nr:AsmA family protein [Candidatus Aquilonibacter sp.]